MYIFSITIECLQAIVIKREADILTAKKIMEKRKAEQQTKELNVDKEFENFKNRIAQLEAENMRLRNFQTQKRGT